MSSAQARHTSRRRLDFGKSSISAINEYYGISMIDSHQKVLSGSMAIPQTSRTRFNLYVKQLQQKPVYAHDVSDDVDGDSGDDVATEVIEKPPLDQLEQNFVSISGTLINDLCLKGAA
ncbi:uncharacterized protein LOC125563048 [Nematostella vectensis]|uniref:uncharacterized protein LOC125563048 n=1 Tax=Nematostella vectensis TaxID=45351 RepID=UPI002077222F|nr:uncharacterized protein LOC125563048 [Nematostella vectensis]